jgi:hypothetical protein
MTSRASRTTAQDKTMADHASSTTSVAARDEAWIALNPSDSVTQEFGVQDFNSGEIRW